MNRYLAAASALAMCAYASVERAEAQLSIDLWGKRMVGLEQAHRRGITGKGILVGVVDEAATPFHLEYADRWQDGFNVDGSPFGPYGLAQHHGTHVAGTVLGANVGVAPGALLYSINWAAQPTDWGFANGYYWGLDQGVRIFNNSWSLVDGQKRTITIGEVTKESIEQANPFRLQAFRDSITAGSVQIFSTGNSNQDQPSAMAGLPHFFPELLPGWLAVSAVGPSGTISSYSDKCGVAAMWCIAAPGGDGDNSLTSPDDIWSSWPDGGYASISGTSMAAPHVTGAVAIAAQMFPNATNAEITQLVLQTATDVGDQGVDSIYGWGLLNVGNIVSAGDATTAGGFANANWSRFETLGAVGYTLRQRLLSARNNMYGTPRMVIEPQGYFAMHESTFSNNPVSSPNANIWLSPVYGSSSIRGGETSAAASTTIGGLVVGADIINHASTTFGLAAGYARSDMTGSQHGDRAQAGSFHIGAYGSWNRNNWVVEGTAQAAWFDQSLQRFGIAGAAGSSVTPIGISRTRSTGLDFSLQVGHELRFDHKTKLMPYLALSGRWQHMHTSTETGSGVFALTVPSAQYGRFDAGPGVRITASPFADERFKVAGDISYARLTSDTNNAVDVNLLGTKIAARSAELGRNLLRVGAQVSMDVNESTSWFAGYNGAVQPNATTHNFAAGLQISF